MIVALASGKGGTGKTTFAVSLAQTLGKNAVLFDCDVEEPNAYLFLKGETVLKSVVETSVPVIDLDRCDGCGLCAEFCAFSALSCTSGKAVLTPDMCHSCGGCKRLCPRKAVSAGTRRIGTIEKKVTDRPAYHTGTLDVGLPLAVPLIRALVRKAKTEKGAVLLDAPPGTSCPVVAVAQDADFVLLVTEPTPFGLHDLALAVDLMREMKKGFAVAINRSKGASSPVHDFCARENIPVLAELPDDRRIAQAYAQGSSPLDVAPDYAALFGMLSKRLFK